MQQHEHQERRQCCLPKDYWPSSNNYNDNRLRAFIETRKKWINGTTLRYAFFNGTTSQILIVENAFRLWKSAGIGLTFTRVLDVNVAELRIKFANDFSAWSYVGTDNLSIPKTQETMHFGWLLDSVHNGTDDTAIHEIGHALGMGHEHQNPLAGIVWNEEAVYKSFAESQGWDRETTYHNVIKKYAVSDITGSNWDTNSIMHYPFEAGLIVSPAHYSTNALVPAGGLSSVDVSQVRSWYPELNVVTVPSIGYKTIEQILIKPGTELSFRFSPPQSQIYTFQTLGDNVDTLLVLFEEQGLNRIKLAADDDTAGQNHAKIKFALVAGKSYIISIRLYSSTKEGITNVAVY